MLQASELDEPIQPPPLRFFAAVAAALLLVPLPEPRAQDHELVRVLAPFPVADRGLALRYPFLGGLDAPRPQFVDIDLDGDYDLFLQEKTGSVMFFRNEGTPAEPDFAFVSDRYQGLDVGQWFVFFDDDGDGDPDLFAERPFGRIRLYRNDGDGADPRFSLAVDTLRADDGSVITAEATIPSFVDVDCNGRVDLMIGRQAGTITRFEWSGQDATGRPIFKFVEDRYQDIEVVGGIGKRGSSLHGASSITFSDLDADGDPDLLWGDFFEPNLILFRNDGTCASPRWVRETDTAMTSGPDPVNTSGFNAPRVTDIDADGNLDLFVGVLGGAFVSSSSSVENFYRLEQTQDGFELIDTRFVPSIDVGSEAAPIAVDLDDDGWLDVVVGNVISPDDPTRASVVLFLSSGSSLVLSDPDAIAFEGFAATPAAADVDCDSDLDLLVGAFDGTVSLFTQVESDGGAEWIPAGSPYQGIDVGSGSAPAWADIDADGDEDLFVGESGGAIHFYRNTGSVCTPVLELESDQYGGIDVGQRSRPAFVDYDLDGDLDLFAGSANGTVRYFRNSGSPQVAQFTPGEPVETPAVGIVSPTAGDFDRDGDADLVVGASSGGLLYYRNDRIATGVSTGPAVDFERPVSLHSVYPNPAKDRLRVEVDLASPGPVRVDILDVLGRRVLTGLDGRLHPGRSALRIDVRSLPAGMYLLTLAGRNRVSVAAPFAIVR